MWEYVLFFKDQEYKCWALVFFFFSPPKEREKLTTKSMFNKPEGSGDGVCAVYPAVQIEHLVGYVLCKQLKIF